MTRTREENIRLIYEVLKENPNGLRFSDLWEKLKGKMAKATLTRALQELEKQEKVQRIPIPGRREVRYVLTDLDYIAPRFLALNTYRRAIHALVENIERARELNLPPAIFGDFAIMNITRIIFRYYKDDSEKAFDFWAELFRFLYKDFQNYPAEDIYGEELIKNLEKTIKSYEGKTNADFVKELQKLEKEINLVATRLSKELEEKLKKCQE